ncbi:MAG TPA: hypothetical protein PK466_14005 [Thermotogota bacterium]|nr:hypothetical protein [Saccharofermentans sp.]HPR97440.1 hypothetical protein [Thermotogota bacterium]
MSIKEIASHYKLGRKAIYYVIDRLETTQGKQFTRDYRGRYDLSEEEIAVITAELDKRAVKTGGSV